MLKQYKKKKYICYNELLVAKERHKKRIKISICIGQNSEYAHSCMKVGKKLFICGSLLTVGKESD